MAPHSFVGMCNLQTFVNKGPKFSYGLSFKGCDGETTRLRPHGHTLPNPLFVLVGDAE